MTALPDWMRPPRAEGWFADDLDNLPEAPRHTELIDGALVFMMSPQRLWHVQVVDTLKNALVEQAPYGVWVTREMTIRLDERNRPEPDVLVTTASPDPNLTWFAPADVLLVVEVTSPESEHRDRTVKLRKYAEAGIQNYWLIEEENGRTVAHVYELDQPAKKYVPVAITRDTLDRPAPFPIKIDLTGIFPATR